MLMKSPSADSVLQRCGRWMPDDVINIDTWKSKGQNSAGLGLCTCFDSASCEMPITVSVNFCNTDYNKASPLDPSLELSGWVIPHVPVLFWPCFLRKARSYTARFCQSLNFKLQTFKLIYENSLHPSPEMLDFFVATEKTSYTLYY